MIRSAQLPFLRRAGHLAAVAALALAGACDDDTSGPTQRRMFDQVQRLGNPLVSEVLLQKRDHPTHGSIGPDQDATLVAPLTAGDTSATSFCIAPTTGGSTGPRTSTCCALPVPVKVTWMTLSSRASPSLSIFN